MCVCVCVCARARARALVCMFVCMYVCVYIYIYIYICMYVYTHTHTNKLILHCIETLVGQKKYKYWNRRESHVPKKFSVYACHSFVSRGLKSSRICCIPAASRWRTYRRYYTLAKAELEFWLRSGYEGLLALTITHRAKYVEFIASK